MSSIQTYNGFHVTPNYYSQGYADGSLFRSIQAGTTAPTYGLNNSSFYQSLMQTQQNLFSGWNNFCGCSGSRLQQPNQPSQPCSGSGGTNGNSENQNIRRRKPVEVHVHHHFYKNNCGGAFTCNQGQGAGATRQTHNAFGSYGAVNRWTERSCNGGCSSPFAFQNTYQTFGYGNPGSPGGVYGYGGSGYNSGYQSYGANFGGYPSYNQSFGGNQNPYQNAYQPMPSYNWGDFNYSWGRSGDSPFGVLPSAYAGYAMTSPFTDFGTAGGIASIASALSLLF